MINGGRGDDVAGGNYGRKNEKDIFWYFFGLAMVIGLFPMGVKAANPAGPKEVTITLDLDDYAYFKQGVTEEDAKDRCNVQSGNYFSDYLAKYISLDADAAEVYQIKAYEPYHK